MQQYLEMLNYILEKGERRENRTGVKRGEVTLRITPLGRSAVYNWFRLKE